MLLKLPKLERKAYQKVRTKNIARQLIQPGIELDVVKVSSTRSGMTVSCGQEEYYLTCNKSDCPAEKGLVLLINIRPTEERIANGEIKVKGWLKHPGLQDALTPENIIKTWTNRFSYREEDPESDSPGLRQPQIGALHMIMGHLKMPLDTATVVMPTGTGKTETMLSALIANKCRRLLVIVPSDSLRRQISAKFATLGLLKQFEIVAEEAAYPIVGVMSQAFKTVEELYEFTQACNVLVTTMQILTGLSEEQTQLLVENCSNVFIDEAHHVKASIWNTFKEKFPAEKIIQFTATPFRNDGKRLDGKIIFNFPLREAQRQGYFKHIEFLPIREFDPEVADKEIAERAVERLIQDRAQGYNHLLMARCSTKERATKVYDLYKDYADLNPVMIYSGAPNFRETYERIINKEAKIIVCVDMLGEGFDLPELKVAAFHDIRKSLPITLQFAGRFTRTKHDEELGDASFIANIADLTVRAELEDLYARDADWNQLLSDASFGRINEEEEFKALMDGFTKLGSSKIPLQNIRTKLSTVVYKNKTNEWSPKQYYKAIPGYDELEFKFHDINRDENMLIIITANKVDVEWVNHKDIYLIDWKLTVVYWETKNNLLFINSSDNSSLYPDLAQAIIGEEAELVRGIDVFKAFHNIKRIRLQNVGLRYFLGKNIRFRMMVGSDVAEALSIAERQKGEKAFVMGIGYENGEPVNIGSSYKGRIWTKLDGDLKALKNWCDSLGSKLTDPNVDPNQILKETLIPTQVVEVPDVHPVHIDWAIEMYLSSETRFRFEIDGVVFDLSSIELRLNARSASNIVSFALQSGTKSVGFELQLFMNTTLEEPYPDFRIVQTSGNAVTVKYGSKSVDANRFFEEFTPTVWFADGSALTGNEYVELKHSINAYPREEIIAWDWTGVDLSAESQHVLPLITNSIQYKVITELKSRDYDIVYDDDYPGEIADVVAMKFDSEKIKVDLFHLKYAVEGVVSNQVKNLYEVCGQAQKSIHWKHKAGNEFFNHLLRRKEKKRRGNSRSRLEKGTVQDLEKLLSIAKKEIPMEFEVYIVQPGISKSAASQEILTLLGVTENFVKEVAGVNLYVITSQ
ncbi:superfamily II DNA or RNA helicase [Pontibacter ummariensis]|uniref:Superfamily II DNA or RNA helicase n=1 Tax=Pontibacter ummariensis TaxID=1610492 RepID=A0A239DUG7_9BACT|nr:DEAD/DEAH box helicase family protein [Pontibacter ummariensis]PRY13776.1 superfamily II DNA or RNA helicase [Pontibacter ummariensis]SNS35392.1 Superfamily II DNA or RNA helicase [Pontibacter ummariensis]